MSFLQILFRSIRRHRLSAGLSLIALSLGLALVLAVASLREQANGQFRNEGAGVDAILAPKGSGLQITLNALYHLDEMPGIIPWSLYEQVRKDELVADAVPFAVGHSYAGFRVNAIDPRFFTAIEPQPGHPFSFDPAQGGQGRAFAGPGEAVAGWAAARALNIKLDQTFSPVHGVRSGDPAHAGETLRFVGILAPTGTPHDRALYMPLEGFYGLEGHGEEIERMEHDLEHREISGAYLRLRRIRGGALHPGIQQLRYDVNRLPNAQLVVPNEVMPQLFHLIGWADRVISALGVLVAVLGVAVLFVVLVSTLREQRRGLAMLRMLGADRRTIFGLVLGEALLLCAGAAVVGAALSHGLVALGSHWVAQETGLRFSPVFVPAAELWAVPGMLMLGLLAGLLPALQAYRLNVLEGLRTTE